MKFKQLLLVTLLTLSFSATSQVNSHAIGVRLGGSHYGHYGGEISYQLGFGDKNRLELDLGARNHKNWSHLGICAIYHWVWNITAGFNWYVGPGACLGNYRHKDWDERGFTLAIGGQIGIEYDFTEHGAPIQLSLDVRPMWGFLTYSDYDNFGYGSALGIRYVIP
ncbi:MAG: hypothetical protein HUJ25_09540 [Crocinitomicaceae bacterium]|nr:hypothetical protein [Crocinitomicaceae bacterium]